MALTIHDELDQAVNAILDSPDSKTIIVAGPGAGKTTVFKKLLAKLGEGNRDNRLVMTFIAGLKKDLEKDLYGHARTYTLHGYCYALLKQNGGICAATGLTSAVQYQPRLAYLVKGDWTAIKHEPSPTFVPKLRNLHAGPEIDFFLTRGCYYDAVGYDDSIAHIQKVLESRPELIPSYDLVIVDEFQDFNRSELAIIDRFSDGSNVVIAGDDDQALYGKFRDANEAYIREFYKRSDYRSFNLPFCMRCPSTIVEATNDIITAAHSSRLLGDRISKRFDAFPPFKTEVDGEYPTIKVVKTSTQTPTTNYFGKYILEQINKITPAEITESHNASFPTVLITGSKPYLEQVRLFLESRGVAIDTKAQHAISIDDPFTRDDGFMQLKLRDDSNLGWRILLDVDKPEGYRDWIAASEHGASLNSLVSDEYRSAVLAEFALWEPKEEEALDAELPSADKPTIRMTSFEGSKGMSAQHVFILGLQEGCLPYNANRIKSIEVRRMIVALTRARRQCYLLYTAGTFTRKKYKANGPSIFVSWIRNSCKEEVQVNKDYWKVL